MRNDQILRQWKMLNYLTTGPKTLSDIVRHLEPISPRTIRRDLEVLSLVLPIVKIPDESGHQWTTLIKLTFQNIN